MSATSFPEHRPGADPGDEFAWVSELLADASAPMPEQVAQRIRHAVAVEWQLRHEDPSRSDDEDAHVSPLHEPADDTTVPPLLPPIVARDPHLAGLDDD